MKKTLVALVAMAAVTGAMAQVTIFGIVDQAYTINSSTAATASGGAKTKTTSIAGQYTGNELGFKGNEDLGGGLKADFQIHFAPNVDGTPAVAAVASSTYPTAYQSHVGVSGGFGAVKLGQYFSPMFFNVVTYDATGLSPFGGNVAPVAATVDLISNAVQYDLPTFVPGLGVSYAMAKGEVGRPTTAALNDISNIRVNYATGPFSAGISTATTKGAAGVSTKDSSTGLSYDLGMAKLFYYAVSTKATTATVATKGSNIGISIPFGATTFNASSSSAKTGPTQAESKGSVLQVKHDLSKRTSLIFQNGSTKITSGASNGDSTKGSALGLWHSF